MSPRLPATLPALVARAAERGPSDEALIAGERRWTYGRLAAEASRVARGLLGLGVARGERVGVLLPNWPEFFSAVLGIEAAGAVAVCLSTLTTERELAHALATSRVSRLLYTPRFLQNDYEAMLEALSRGPGGAGLVGRIACAPSGERVPPGALDLAAFPAPEGDPAAALRGLDVSAPGDAAAVFFTSGSTARPKALVHSHRGLVHQALVCSAAFGLDPRDRCWGGLPMFFTGGFVAVALVAFAAGAAVVLQDRTRPDLALERMERERVSFFAGWQLAQALVDEPSFPRRRLSIRKGIFARHPAAERLLAPDHVAVSGYGMSETATFVCQARWDDPPERRRSGFGRPLPGVEVRILSAEGGAPLGPGEVGEIAVRGPSMMLGYLGPGGLECPLDANGLLRTGDLGWLEPDGTLHFAGRSKEVIKTAGVNVAAAEVEERLEALDEVLAAYVVAVPDAARGENVGAFVVPAAGRPLDPSRVLAHCRRELASYKVPRHLFLLRAADVPRTATQKVDKRRLAALAAERAGGPEDLAVRAGDA